jgi:hypothetical protein
MLMHPDTAYAVSEVQRQDLMATAARSRLAAACGAARPSGRGGAPKRLIRVLIRVAATARSAGRTRQPVPQA